MFFQLFCNYGRECLACCLDRKDEKIKCSMAAKTALNVLISPGELSHLKRLKKGIEERVAFEEHLPYCYCGCINLYLVRHEAYGLSRYEDTLHDLAKHYCHVEWNSLEPPDIISRRDYRC